LRFRPCEKTIPVLEALAGLILLGEMEETVTGQLVEQHPFIHFHCSCGAMLYEVTTNVLALEAKMECACGRKYECRDSLIAEEVHQTPLPIPASHIQSHSPEGTPV
jgi:hypothetical protein